MQNQWLISPRNYISPLWQQQNLDERVNHKTHASASVKGYPHSSVFAMGKHALRGLASAMGRELAPQGVHVCHFVIDGGVRNALKGRTEGPGDPADKYLCPDAIANSYMHVVDQDRSSWSWEIELRPYGENY